MDNKESNTNIGNSEQDTTSTAPKKNEVDEYTYPPLYYQQMSTLDTFLSNGAITKAQYDKSVAVLKEKLRIKK